MRFVIEDKDVCNVTGRAKAVTFVAEECPEELWLTNLRKCFEAQKARKMTIELEDGRTMDLHFNNEQNNDLAF